MKGSPTTEEKNSILSNLQFKLLNIMVECIEVDKAETWGKHKIPMHLALSDRNWSLALTC